jgi:hypothetical protein
VKWPQSFGEKKIKTLGLRPKPRRFLKKAGKNFNKNSREARVLTMKSFFVFGKKTGIPLSRFPFGKRCRRIPDGVKGRSPLHGLGREPQGLKAQTSENFNDNPREARVVMRSSALRSSGAWGLKAPKVCGFYYISTDYLSASSTGT